MRRGLLLVIGFSGSLLAMIWLCVSVSRCWTQGVVKLPCQVQQTDLTVLELRSYDGPFVEDGSGRQVRDVAAVVLHNRGQSLLRAGAVKLYQSGQLLVFSFTMVPPGGRVLVLEQRAKPFLRTTVNACWGWCVTGEREARLQVEEAGRTALAVQNTCGELLRDTCVYFKDYDPGAQLYIGGITHSVPVRQLRPGQRIVLPVFRYLSGSSMVIQ